MRRLLVSMLLVLAGCGGGEGTTPPEATPAEVEVATPAPAPTPAEPAEDLSGVTFDPVPREGFFPFDPLNAEWMTERGLAIDADAVRRTGYRTAKLIIDDGEREASAAELATMDSRYCQDSDVRTWNEDRCAALEARTCEGDTCRYRHVGNCSGFVFGQGVLLTAAHCVDGMVDHPERVKNSVVLMPGPFGTPERVAIGTITVGKEDFDHHWVALGEENPVDVATIAIQDRNARPVEIATELPAPGSPLFLVGYPRVERRPAADRKRSGYEPVYGIPTASFGTLVDANPKGLPLCNVDGMQEHWELADPCPEGEVEVDGEATWKGVISRSVALADYDSCNGYSGAPVMDADGRLVGVNITLVSQTDPQERFDPEARMVFVPIAPAMKRLGLEIP